MEFEWDPEKSEATLGKRGFDFARAARIFAGVLIEFEDRRRDYGEVRIRAIGEVEGDVFAVVYTLRGDVVRIISARLANRRERGQWQSSVKR